MAELHADGVRPELLNRRRSTIRVELANAILEDIEGFHNRRRRDSALGLANAISDGRRPADAALVVQPDVAVSRS